MKSRKKAGSGVASDKKGPVGGEGAGKKKRRKINSREDDHPVGATSLNGSTPFPDPKGSEEIEAAALADERAAVGRLLAELDLALAEQRRIEDLLATLTELEQSRIVEVSSRLLETEKQIELLESALNEKQAQLAAAAAQEASAQRALEQAEKINEAGKEQLADAQALLSRERQRSAELADAMAAIENMRALEREHVAELTLRTADAEKQRLLETGKNAALEQALRREEAASAAAQKQAEEAAVRNKDLEAKAAHLEREI